MPRWVSDAKSYLYSDFVLSKILQKRKEKQKNSTNDFIQYLPSDSNSFIPVAW